MPTQEIFDASNNTFVTPTSERVRKELARRPHCSIVDLTNAYLTDAYARGASDIHIDPENSNLRVRMRVDGQLQETYTFPKHIHDECIARLKILAGLRTDEHTSAQDGRFTFEVEKNSWIDLRMSIMPTYYGENAIIRLLSFHNESQSLDELGMCPESIQRITQTLTKNNGLILVTGPTGSGKTTTLYALMRLLVRHNISLITLEDPIEYSIPDITQVQISDRLSYANGLRSVVRQDPDVIMVGEIRDGETASLAMNAALTGHLVLSTLHTSSALTTLPRLIDLGVEPYLIPATLRLVIAQRLVREICTGCKEVRVLSESDTRELHDAFGNDWSVPSKLYTGRGCSQCNDTGYKGRLGIFEIIPITVSMHDAIISKNLEKVRSQSSTLGVSTLQSDGIRKVAEGRTTLEELFRIRHE